MTTSHDIGTLKSIQIETTSWCNRKCVFCPNSTIEKTRDMQMSWDTIKVIVEGLARMKYGGRVHLYGNGEPLSDPRIIEIIRYARKELPDTHLFISTNGDLASGDRSLKNLLEAGLSEVHVSHYDDKNHHLADEVLPGVHHFGLGVLGLEFYNRGGNVKVPSVSNHKRCWWAWGKAYINWKGDWCLCCSDWKGELVFGNVHDRSLTSIWNDDRYQNYRQAHLTGSGKENLTLCNQCNR